MSDKIYFSTDLYMHAQTRKIIRYPTNITLKNLIKCYVNFSCLENNHKTFNHINVYLNYCNYIPLSRRPKNNSTV